MSSLLIINILFLLFLSNVLTNQNDLFQFPFRNELFVNNKLFSFLINQQHSTIQNNYLLYIHTLYVQILQFFTQK